MIRVITKRLINCSQLDHTKIQLNALYKQASKNNGFLGANTYLEYNGDDNKTLWTFSDWNSYNDWNKWLNSSNRILTIENSTVDMKIDHTVIKKLKNEIFLL